MSELLRTILIMSISGSIIAILLFVLKPFVKNRLPKFVQYYLWLVVITALLVPVSKIIILTNNEPSQLSVVPNISETVARYAITQEEEMDRLQNIPLPIDKDNPEYMHERRTAQSPFSMATTYFVAAYPIGALIVLLYTIITFTIFIHRLKRCNKTTEFPCSIPVYRNPLAATPMLIGLFRPTIILPDREYSDTQLRAVLLHELTHLRRKDVLVKWLSVIVTAVHWFNPIVWLVRREIGRACELSCDEAVIRNLDTDGKKNYGETLLYVAADSKTPKTVLSTTMCEEKKALKERLGAIMKSKKHTRLAIIISAVLLVAVGVTAIALGAGRAKIIDNSNLIVVNESTAPIASISIFHNNETLVVSNADNSPLKRGDTANFQFDAVKGEAVRVTVSGANWNLITENEFIKDFSAATPVYLYIRDDNEGNTYITDGGFAGIQLTLDEVRALAAKGDPSHSADSAEPQPTTPPTRSPYMSSWKPLHELPVDYSTEQAVADGVYVNIHDSQIYNEVMVDRFYADVYSGSVAFLRAMLYTIEGDAILLDYQYDGEMFTVTHDSTRDKFGEREITTYNYKYLVADDRSAGQPLSYYLSNEKNISAGTGDALIEGIWQLPSPSTQNERAPQLEVTLTTNGFPEQRIEAAQLTTSWSYIDEDGNSVGYESDSPHALQLNNYDDITLRLNGSNGEISFNFGGSYKPQSISVQRWDAVYYMGQQYIESSINQNESVVVNGNTLRISNDRNDYIYEVYAVYEQGSSYYAFRVNAGS